MIFHLGDFCSCYFRQQIKFMVPGKMMTITAQHILVSEDFGEVLKYWDACYKHTYGWKDQFLYFMIIISTGIWLLPFHISCFFNFQQILGHCKAHRLHNLLVVIPWQKCQAIWSPQHQHQHLMDRWHLCRLAGMKRALSHFQLGCSFTTVQASLSQLLGHSSSAVEN